MYFPIDLSMIIPNQRKLHKNDFSFLLEDTCGNKFDRFTQQYLHTNRGVTTNNNTKHLQTETHTKNNKDFNTTTEE